jgi:hypothetical protein
MPELQMQLVGIDIRDLQLLELTQCHLVDRWGYAEPFMDHPTEEHLEIPCILQQGRRGEIHELVLDILLDEPGKKGEALFQ